MKIAILGHGVVGSGVVEVLTTNRSGIEKKAGCPVEIKYILDRKDFPDLSYSHLFVKDFEVIASDPEVDVVVPPNAGKSSVINSLSRRAAVGVASTPGFTKTMQEIEVTGKIRILDCPGVVTSSGADITPSMVLRNSIKVELLEDPIRPVAFIIEKVPKEQLVEAYDIGTFGDAEDFLAQLARKRGRVLKGGEPDLEGVARIVLQDWNKGRIRYFTLPPTDNDMVEGVAELVTPYGEVYQMGRTMDFEEKDYRDFQIQHVFEIVRKGKKSAERGDEGEPESGDEDEKPAAPGELPPEEKQELDDLAQQYQTVSFDGI